MRKVVIVLACVFALAGCSIPMGDAGNFNVIPTYDPAKGLGMGVSFGGSLFGMDLNLSATGDCVGVAGAVGHDGRCVGFGVDSPVTQDQFNQR